MKRLFSLAIGAAGAVLFAVAGHAAEVIGTIVSTNPAENTIVLQTTDGQQVVYRAAKTTRIQRGDTTIQLQSLQPGTEVLVMADPAPQPAQGTTVVHPIASGIVVKTSSPPDVSSPGRPDSGTGVHIETPARGESKVDVEVEED